ncbi:hypothetical protein G9A89_002943 [Geosiphon pyriformis]|nr:hypothetical protein G9A89_002943 [Geosiphon pyriformis]
MLINIGSVEHCVTVSNIAAGTQAQIFELLKAKNFLRPLSLATAAQYRYHCQQMYLSMETDEPVNSAYDNYLGRESNNIGAAMTEAAQKEQRTK